MARPTKLTAQVQARILDAIELGATYELAAGAGGISYETLRVWLHEKPVFSAAVKRAEARAATKWLTLIDQAASDGNWQAAAWKLERRYPQQYGRTVQQQEHSGTIRVEFVNDWRTVRGGGAEESEG